jgi:hypothetical protein
MDYLERLEALRKSAAGELSTAEEAGHVEHLNDLWSELTQSDREVVNLMLSERKR